MGRARTHLERLAARLDLKDRARFLGKVPRDEDLAAYYLASEAFWFPSNARSEAYGLVQVEAMASGCPVINTAIPHSGVPWVSRHEETGLTVPVDDPAAFAAAALRLLNEPGLRDRLAAGARARAIAEFHCDAMGSRSKELYSTTLAAARLDSGHGWPSKPEQKSASDEPELTFHERDLDSERATLTGPAALGIPIRHRLSGDCRWAATG